MGDFNLNLLTHHSHVTTGEFLDVMFSRKFLPLITRPTRLTSHTATLIDNIFTNNIDDFVKSGFLATDISDHLPIFSLVHSAQPNTLPNYRSISCHETNPVNIPKLRDELSNINWSELHGYDDPHEAYARFRDRFTILYNKCFPLKRKKAGHQAIKKPWITSGLLKSIRKKNTVYKQFLGNPTPGCEQHYKKNEKQIEPLLESGVLPDIFNNTFLLRHPVLSMFLSAETT